MNKLPYYASSVFRISVLVIFSYLISDSNVLASHMSSPTHGNTSSLQPLLSGNITYVPANVSIFTTNSSDFTTHSMDFTTVISTTLSDFMPPLPVNISGWPPGPHVTHDPPQAPTGTAAPPTPVCEINGRTYQIRDTFNPDPCTFCTCNLHVVGDLPRGHVTCELADCLYHIQAAPCVDLTVPEGQCCPICPNGPTCYAPDGSVLGHGQVYRPESGGECWCLGPSFGGDAPCTTPTTTEAPPTTTATTPITMDAQTTTTELTPSTTYTHSNTTAANSTAAMLTADTTSLSAHQSTSKPPASAGQSSTTASLPTATATSTIQPMTTVAAVPSPSSTPSISTRTTPTAQPSLSDSTNAPSRTSALPRTTTVRTFIPFTIIG